MNDERERILHMVEKGQLTVAEALRLLESLEKPVASSDEKQAEIMNEITTIMHEEEQSYRRGTHDDYQTKSTTDKIFEFVDSAFKKVKEFDLDFNFGKYETVNHIFQHTNPNVAEIDIDIANGSLEIIPWEQHDVRIECEAKVYRVDSVDEARKQFLKEVDFEMEESKLRFILQQKMMKVRTICYVPQKEYASIRLRLFNGPITAEQLHAQVIKGKTANGKVLFTDTHSGDVELETANGHIVIENGVIGKIEAETINGKVQLNGDFEEVDVQTFNGNIHCLLENNRCTFLQAKAVTGAVEIVTAEDLKMDAELKTNLGSFKVELGGMEVVEEKNDMAQKTLRFRTNADQKRQLHLLVDTKTGSITCKKKN